MTGDLFPVAMISFRSVASLLLEPLMNVCWRQIFAILFCLKRNNWRLSKASTSWFDILGYFTIFSSIQTYGIQLYTKNIQSNCCTEEGLALRLWSSGNSVPIPLTTPSLMFRLWSSEKQIVGVGSRSRRTKPITKRGNVHCDWFILPLLLPTPTIWFSLDHKRNVSDGVVSGVGRNGNVLILLTPIPSRIWLRLRLRFLIFTRSLCNFPK